MVDLPPEECAFLISTRFGTGPSQKGTRLHINQVPQFALTELSSFGYTADQKSKDQSVHAVRGLLRKLSKEQIAELLRDLD